jgi:hypothetical protein
MTKQPSPQELNEKISYETARQREVAFFDNNSPWNSQSHLRQRMGTANLTKELSKLLGSVINKACVPSHINCLIMLIGRTLQASSLTTRL